MENKSIGVVFHVEFDGDVQKSVAAQKSMVLSIFPMFFAMIFGISGFSFSVPPDRGSTTIDFFSVPPDRGSATLEKIIYFFSVPPDRGSAAAECIRTGPNRPEQVRTRPKTAKNWQNHRTN